MNMIFSSICDNGLAPGFINQVANDTKQCWSPIFDNYCISVFYRKNTLNINLMVGICHDCWFYMFRSYGTLLLLFINFHGLKSMATICTEPPALINPVGMDHIVAPDFNPVTYFIILFCPIFIHKKRPLHARASFWVVIECVDWLHFFSIAAFTTISSLLITFTSWVISVYPGFWNNNPSFPLSLK
jgi:hypothetical protein